MVTTSSPSSLSPSSLCSVTSEEFLPPVSPWIALSGLILTGAIATAIGFATVTQYNVVVKAAAVVRPSGELRLVESEVEGTIRQILVRENQTVQLGDVIALLDDTQLQTRKAQLHSTLQHYQLQLMQLEGQVRSLQSQIQAETTAYQAGLTSGQAELSRTQQDYQNQRQTAQAEVQAAKADLNLAQDELSRYTQLVNNGAISTIEFNQRVVSTKYWRW